MPSIPWSRRRSWTACRRPGWTSNATSRAPPPRAAIDRFETTESREGLSAGHRLFETSLGDAIGLFGRIARRFDLSVVKQSYAADNAVNFMVMGGYGHSRLREFILGGVTRRILRSMTVQVLMSH